MTPESGRGIPAGMEHPGILFSVANKTAETLLDAVMEGVETLLSDMTSRGAPDCWRINDAGSGRTMIHVSHTCVVVRLHGDMDDAFHPDWRIAPGAPDAARSGTIRRVASLAHMAAAAARDRILAKDHEPPPVDPRIIEIAAMMDESDGPTGIRMPTPWADASLERVRPPVRRAIPDALTRDVPRSVNVDIGMLGTRPLIALRSATHHIPPAETLTRMRIMAGQTPEILEAVREAIASRT
jgi:hypothetical protein